MKPEVIEARGGKRALISAFISGWKEASLSILLEQAVEKVGCENKFVERRKRPIKAVVL